MTLQNRDPVSRNVGTELLFENDRVRVWDMQLAPGESSELHHHDSDYVFAYVSPVRLESTEPGGEPKVSVFEDGYVQYNVVGRAGRTHRVRNVGEEAHRHVIVEILGPSVSEDTLPPEHNGRRSEPA